MIAESVFAENENLENDDHLDHFGERYFSNETNIDQ